jgi:hypothetical protein
MLSPIFPWNHRCYSKKRRAAAGDDLYHASSRRLALGGLANTPAMI